MAKAASSNATDNWGTPDWRDADAYPKVASTSPQQWAWELLRRSPDYRLDWNKHIGRFFNDRGEWDGAAVEREEYEPKHEEFVERAFAEFLASHQLAPRSFTLFSSFSSPTKAIAGKYGLAHSDANNLLNPRFEHPPGFAADVVTEVDHTKFYPAPPQPRQVLVESGHMKFYVEEKSDEAQPRKFWIEFDPSLPPEPQLAAARRLLLARALSPAIKPPFEKFPLYLRLLDANEENPVPSDKEIGTHLFKGRSGQKLYDAVSKGLAAARKWQTKYLLIAGHSPKE